MSDKIGKAQREATRTFQQAGKPRPATEYELEQKAFQKNYERLRAERLARKAENPKENYPFPPIYRREPQPPPVHFGPQFFRVSLHALTDQAVRTTASTHIEIDLLANAI